MDTIKFTAKMKSKKDGEAKWEGTLVMAGDHIGGEVEWNKKGEKPAKYEIETSSAVCFWAIARVARVRNVHAPGWPIRCWTAAPPGSCRIVAARWRDAMRGRWRAPEGGAARRVPSA